MGLILDTSVIVAAERGRFNFEKFLLKEASGLPIYITTITASELLHGVHRASGARRQKREAFVESVLAEVSILPFDLVSARKHSELRANLESIGNSIGPHDLIIAATCVALNHTVATLNIKEFSRVPNLSLAEVTKYEVIP